MMKVLRLLPNCISLLRIFAVPLTVYLLLSQQMTAAFWLIIVAGVSDGLDGYLAKRLNAVTLIGTYLDPLADKTMLIAVCLCLAHLGYLPCWIIALAILRDLLILGGVLLSNVLELELSVDPILISKLNTVLQIIMVAFALGREAMGWDLLQVMSALVYLVAVTTIVSGTLYLARWTGALTSGENPASGATSK
ncbi:MAG: CDP-alcohol phosphatidyltransferase [Rhodospirillaceae bacterium]|jgi:cardiolipin synthase|nr:CDP-alcohol phosphatidyltransferase [Rhodospirillaceae bacterium]